MTRGTKRDDCNIDNIDEYHAMRDEALTNVKAPPPSEYDVAQFKEAFAEMSANMIMTGRSQTPNSAL